MENEYLEIKKILKKYNQEHLLNFFDELNNNQKKKLLEEIKLINFNQINELYKQTKIKNKIENDLIEPIKYINKEKLKKEEIEYYKKIGENIIKNNEYAVVTMAGGQRNKIRSYTALREHMILGFLRIKAFLNYYAII